MPANTPPPSRVRALLAYFLRHPRREETLEDVIRWRIRQDLVDLSIEEVTQAIEWLERERFIVRTHSPAGATTIRLNDARIADAQELLAVMAPAAIPARSESERAAGRLLERHDTGAPQRPVLQRAIAWIDATLLCVLRTQLKSLGDQPTPASHALVEALLVTRVWPAGSEPAEACGAAERAAADLKDALAAADADDDPVAAVALGLSLDFVELQAVLLILAAELDGVYQLVFSVLNDARTPTLGLLCELLGPGPTTRAGLTFSEGLTRWRLLEAGGALPHADEPLHLDPPVIAWLLGDDASLLDDPRLRPLIRRGPWPGGAWLRQADDLVDAEVLAERIAPGVARPEWTVLIGEDGSVWRALVETAADKSAAALLRVASPGPVAVTDHADVAARLARAAQLHRSVPVLDIRDLSAGSDSAAFLATVLEGLTAAGCRGVLITPDLDQLVGALPREPMCVRHRGRADEATLATAYSAAASDGGLALSEADARQLAHAFPLTLDAIDQAVRLAVLETGDCLPAEQQAAALVAACRRVASPDLPRFARRVKPVFTLDDVVLPADRRAQLQEIVTHVSHASQVLQTWGFGAQLPYGRGVAALFTGPSGTGKTMCAQAIAHALQTDAFVVDLSRVMSKFVGESEKNIDAAFADAERAGALLQIDEADALFAKRSDVKDSHDRYANFLVSFLLHRMETFNGVAILTTNFGRTVDQAFLRRLRFVVEFPKPDAQAREAIWRRCLPREAPVRDDVNLRFLARRFELSGGNIRSATLRAAFLAVADGSERIEMRHLIGATRAELLKLGMAAAERELAEFDAAQRASGARVA